MRPADLANVIHDLPAKRRGEIAAALDDERLADVLEELPEEDQVEILGQLDNERAADVLEEMSPDDAADLIAELPPETAEALLQLMEPDEAEDVRRLMSYEERTAGGMMTTEPVILPPTRRSPRRSPTSGTPSSPRRSPRWSTSSGRRSSRRPGRFLGVAHIQRLLREPPSTLVGRVLDTDIEPLRPTSTLEDVARHLATYNLVAAPVVDADGIGGHLSTFASLGRALRGRLQPLLPRQGRRPAPATTSTSRATPRPASTPAPSSRAASTEDQLDHFRREIGGDGPVVATRTRG